MNTPFGNSITTAEHAVAMIFARPPDPAGQRLDPCRQMGKNRFMGVEITGKTLGIVGCGNIGSIVATRGVGLKMHVIAFDPFLSDSRAEETWCRQGRTGRAFRPRRLHYPAHAR
jgi:D-3-phosphoglycerate dehydrogenase